MEISFLGHSSFRIKGKKAILVTDPYDPSMVGFKYSGVSGDLVTISHQHGDHNQSQLVKGVQRVIDGPGEYEIMGVSVIGLSSFHDNKKGELRGKNTIYVIEMDGLRIAHLGDLGHQLREKDLVVMGSIDILMIPVGGEYTIGPAQAVEVARAIEAKIVIPMHYQMKGLDKKTFGKLTTADHFTSDLGLQVEKLEKLVIKKESLGEENKVVILEKKGK